MDFLKRISNKGKIKYSALLAGLLALVLSIIVLFNTIISILGDRYNWFFDMTDEQFYSASDAFVDAMKKVNGNAKLEIIFLDEKDTIKNDQSSVDGVVGLSYVHQTATDLARKLDNVTVSYHSTDDYEFLKQFEGGDKLTEKNVIIRRTDTEGTQFNVFNPSAFYAFDGNTNSLFAYNGEVKLLEAAIRLATDDEPTVYFTASHGEKWYEVVNNTVKQTAIGELFVSAGFTVSPIDLLEEIYTCQNVIDANGTVCGKEYSPKYNFGITDESKREPVSADSNDLVVKRDFECSCGAEPITISESMLKVRDRIPTNARAIIINEPLTDFIDVDDTHSEFRMLEAYLATDGAVMTFLNKDANLTEFYGWLKTWGGITVNTSNAPATTNNGTNTLISGSIPSSDATSAYFSDLLSLDIDPKFDKAITLSIDPNFIDGIKIETGDNIDRISAALVNTPSNVTFNGKTQQHTLMAITKSSSLLTNSDGIHEDEDEFSSYLIVCSSGFTSQLTTASGAIANSKIMRSLISATTPVQIYSTNIEFKIFNDYALDITVGQASTFLILSVLVMPLIIGAAGFVIIFRRKRR